MENQQQQPPPTSNPPLTDAEQKKQLAKQKRKEKNEQMKKNNEEYLRKMKEANENKHKEQEKQQPQQEQQQQQPTRPHEPNAADSQASGPTPAKDQEEAKLNCPEKRPEGEDAPGEKQLTEQEKKKLAKQKRQEKNEQMKKNNAEYLRKKQEELGAESKPPQEKGAQPAQANGTKGAKQQAPEFKNIVLVDAAQKPSENSHTKNKKRSLSQDLQKKGAEPKDEQNQFHQQQQQAEKQLEDQLQKHKTQQHQSSQLLLHHLQQQDIELNDDIGSTKFNQCQMHSSIMQVCLKFKHGQINGSNNFCIQLLNALKQFVMDIPETAYKQQSFSQYLEQQLLYIQEQVEKFKKKTEGLNTVFIYCQRLLIAYLRDQTTIPVDTQKHWICEYIDKFIDEKIIHADELIIQYAQDLIKDGDYIITYGRSQVIEQLLIINHNKGKKFTPIIIDNAPLHEGKELLKSLTAHGLECIYTLLSHVSYFIKRAKKIFVGASSMLQNGALISRVGTALLACLAKDNQKQFYVFCETYKFSKKCLLDSLTWNEMLRKPNQQIESSNRLGQELGSSKHNDDILESPSFNSMENVAQNVSHINLRYDLTPCDYITMVVTEIGKYPPSSVPQITREFEKYEIIDRIKPPTSK